MRLALSGIARAMLAAVVGSSGMVLAAASPASADLVWQPEGRFFPAYVFPLAGQLAGTGDTNFQLEDARLGMRLLVLPGFSLRAVGQALNTGTSRFPLVLRWGYAQYDNPAFGTVRLGQVPTPWSVKESAVVGNRLFGPGIAKSAKFLSSGGLGVSYLGRLGLDRLGLPGSTASAEVGAFYTDGLLGAGELSPNAVLASYTGPGPSAAARLSFAAPGGWSAHLFERYGLVVDQQAGAAAAWDGAGWHLVGEAVASVSTPVYSTTTGQVVHEPAATDAAALLGARYNLGALWADLWKVNLLGRLGAVLRNVSATVRPADSPYPVPSRRATYSGLVGVDYSVNDSADVGLDLQFQRDVVSTASQSVSVGLRMGVQF